MRGCIGQAGLAGEAGLTCRRGPDGGCECLRQEPTLPTRFVMQHEERSGAPGSLWRLTASTNKGKANAVPGDSRTLGACRCGTISDTRCTRGGPLGMRPCLRSCCLAAARLHVPLSLTFLHLDAHPAWPLAEGRQRAPRIVHRRGGRALLRGVQQRRPVVPPPLAEHVRCLHRWIHGMLPDRRRRCGSLW